MPDYLLDTNHASHLLGGQNPALIARIDAVVSGGASFCNSMTVLGELYFAVFASQRKEKNLAALRGFLRDVIVWPFDRAAAEEFGRIRAKQKSKGRPIPPTDSQIAAVCRLHDLTLLTDDRHFQYVDRLRVENWLRTPT